MAKGKKKFDAKFNSFLKFYPLTFPRNTGHSLDKNINIILLNGKAPVSPLPIEYLSYMLNRIQNIGFPNIMIISDNIILDISLHNFFYNHFNQENSPEKFISKIEENFYNLENKLGKEKSFSNNHFIEKPKKNNFVLLWNLCSISSIWIVSTFHLVITLSLVFSFNPFDLTTSRARITYGYIYCFIVILLYFILIFIVKHYQKLKFFPSETGHTHQRKIPKILEIKYLLISSVLIACSIYLY